jgi:hypothetical protein
MRILPLNENHDLAGDLLALESEPISNPRILDRLAPDWQLRLHDGVVIDHILDVINRPRKGYKSRASLSNFPRPGQSL